jgi:hypothetical protein
MFIHMSPEITSQTSSSMTVEPGKHCPGREREASWQTPSWHQDAQWVHSVPTARFWLAFILADWHLCLPVC